MPPLLVVEGVFYRQDASLHVALEAGGVAVLEDLLGPYKGFSVEVRVHHWPPDPPRPDQPGFGCCLWNGHCPRHASEPGWMYTHAYEGELSSWEDLQLEPLLGHRSRLVLFSEPPDVDGQDLDSLLNMANELQRTLQGLRREVDGE